MSELSSLWSFTAWVQVLVSLLSGLVTLGKLPNLPAFSGNMGIISVYLMSLSGLNELILVKQLEKVPHCRISLVIRGYYY